MPSANAKTRLAWLVAVHLVLAAAPLLSLLFAPTVKLLPLLWATSAAPVGSLMALSVWVGMGPQRVLKRLLLGICGSVYAAIWPFAAGVVRMAQFPDDSYDNLIGHYLSHAAQFAIVVTLFGSMFMIMRRRWSLEQQRDADEPTADRGLRFSVMNLLVLMSSLAVVLTLLQASRGAGNAVVSITTWQTIAANVLGFGAYFVNTACAVHAALRPGPFRRNLLLVLLVSILLGVALSFAARHDLSGWWLVAGGTLISIIPTTVVILTMLIVRSCGYRLVRNPTSATDFGSY